MFLRVPYPGGSEQLVHVHLISTVMRPEDAPLREPPPPEVRSVVQLRNGDRMLCTRSYEELETILQAF